MFARHTQEASQRTYERYEKVCKIPTGCKKGRTGRNPGRALRPNLGFRAVFVPVFSVLGLCGWKGKAPSHGTARSLPCLSRPRPPAAVNPQKWVWRRLPSESGQPGEEGPARKRKRRARREPCKRRAPGRGSCRGHTEGCGSRQGKPKRTAARRRAQPALPAPRRRATPPPAPPPALASLLVRICRRGGAADAIPTMLRGVPPPSLPPPLPLVEEDGGRRSGGPRHPAI